MHHTISSLDDQKADLASSSRAGFGVLETSCGRLPLLALDVKARIWDVTTETMVRQTFRNGLTSRSKRRTSFRCRTALR